jgi:hypothetical protein
MQKPGILVTAALLVVFALAPARADDVTESGLAFLRIGVGARASAMGEAFVAVADDASATYWNPAGLALHETTQVMFVNNSFIQDISQNFVSVTTSLGLIKVGGAFNIVNLGTLERRDVQGNLEGEFKPFDLAASFSAAYSPLDWLDVGGTVKGVLEDIDTETAYGALFDVGAIARTPVQGLSVGGVVQNLGPTVKFIDVPFDPPRFIRAGASWVRQLPGMTSRIGLALDLVVPKDDDTQVNVGGEWTYNDLISGRIGYRGGADTQGVTSGFGVRYMGLFVDYAYVPYSEDLGGTHRIGVSYRFR